MTPLQSLGVGTSRRTALQVRNAHTFSTQRSISTLPSSSSAHTPLRRPLHPRRTSFYPSLATTSQRRHASSRSNQPQAEGDQLQPGHYQRFQESMSKHRPRQVVTASQRKFLYRQIELQGKYGIFLLNRLAYSPASWNWLAQGLLSPMGFYTHIKHRWTRYQYSASSLYMAEDKSFLVNEGGRWNKFGNFGFRWFGLNVLWRGRYRTLVDDLFAQWKNYNKAIARRDLSDVETLSMLQARKDAHLAMSTNRILDWKITEQHGKPKVMWARYMPAKEMGQDMSVLQLCLRFDTDQSITTLPTPPDPVMPPDMMPRSASASLDEYQIRAWRETLGPYWDSSKQDSRLPREIRRIRPIQNKDSSDAEILKTETQTRRVVDNVVFQLHRVNGTQKWRIRQRVSSVQPHFTMTPEAWDKIQQDYTDFEEPLGIPPVLFWPGSRAENKERMKVEMKRREENKLKSGKGPAAGMIGSSLVSKETDVDWADLPWYRRWPREVRAAFRRARNGGASGGVAA